MKARPAIRKFAQRLSASEAQIYLESVLMPLCEIYPDARLFSKALSFANDLKISFYDALIVAAAVLAECDILWTEDLQHGRRVGDLVIRNLF